jgi:hypothetical protein
MYSPEGVFADDYASRTGGQRNSANGPVDFLPALAAGAGSMVTFRLIAGDGSAPVSVANEGSPVGLPQ